MAGPSEPAGSDVSQELAQAVECTEWAEVMRLFRSSDCCDEQRYQAIMETVRRARERFVYDNLTDIVDACGGEQLGGVVSHLCRRRLWSCVGRVLQCDLSAGQRRWVLEGAMKHANDDYFLRYIYPHCLSEELEHVVALLVSRGLWDSVGFMLLLWQGRISPTQHSWAIEQAGRHASGADLSKHILPRCSTEDLEHAITHLVSRGLWWLVDMVLERGVSAAQHRWAVEQASRRADEWKFAEYMLHHCAEEQLEEVLTHMASWGVWKSVPRSDVGVTHHVLSQIVSRGRWRAVGRFLQRGISTAYHRWAVEQASRHASDDVFADRILPQCGEEEREQVVTHLVSRGLWKSVGQVLGRGVSAAQHRWAAEQTSRRSGQYYLIHHILPHCVSEVLDRVIPHLVSRGLWDCVDRVLERGVGAEQHGWAVEQASRHAGEWEFVFCILHHCREEQLQQVLAHMVSRGLWKPAVGVTHTHVLSQLVLQCQWKAVGKFLQRDIRRAQHRWAVEQASKHADGFHFVYFILPQCHDEELQQVSAHMVSRGLWKPVDSAAHSNVSVTQHILSQLVSQGLWYAVGRFLERDISSAERRWAVEQAREHADDKDFVHYIVPQCRDEELEEVITHLVLQGLWQSVGEVLGRDVSCVYHRWAVEQASMHASDGDFASYMLPQCQEEELEQVVTHLVSRGLWGSVDTLLERGIGAPRHGRVIEEALRSASECAFACCILHHCAEEQLEQVLAHMVLRGLWEPVTRNNVSVTQHVLSQIVSQGLWEAVGRFLERDISSAQHRLAVEQASRHADDDDFVHYVLPQCHDEELEQVVSHLVRRGLGWSVGRVLERGISSAQHREAVLEAATRADDVSFDCGILQHCREDDVVAVFPLLVATRKWRCTQHILYDMVPDTLYTWITSGRDGRAHDTLFWKFIHHCCADVSLALDLTKAVTQGTHWCHSVDLITHDLAERVSWQRALCESLVTALLHTLCYVVCSDDRQLTHSTERTKQCVSDVYGHITACIKDNTDSFQDNILKTIQNKPKWTSVFTEIADTHKTDPLFLLHFLRGLNLYHISRRRENDDAILLVVLAVFPLFPQLQSVALRMMLRDKRWDVIKKAGLSHVWEHDRRRLFKAAVEQGQWSVVRQWSDHTVHDDQREWAMKEAFKEEEWEVYLLLADHGLTMPEQMHAHYMVAKYGDWNTVLQMVERGGDITEVSELLENWVTGNLRKKPQGNEATVYLGRCEKLIRLRLRFAENSVRSPMKALERCKWGSVLFNILHEPTEDYFSRVLDKVREEQQWHILMHLVRLGMNKAERDWLFPQMVRQQQWGVCRMLLEYGVDEQLCVEALPELMERNQWTLVARVMEYNVDDAVRHQVMQCAFQSREGALFWHCLNIMKHKQPLSMEAQGKLFHQAISRDIWQAVKPLMVEKGGPRIQHRDMAFLEAIEQHLWDVVDYCQLYRADINMEDENGETPLHREARKEEWKAVEEIVLRDGKPNLLDKDGVSVLNRLIDSHRWDTVKLVIMYGGNIHLPARCNEYGGIMHTPLQLLIDARQADVIQFSIMWCGDQKKGVNDKGETCFHAVCGSDYRWDVMEDLIVRKVDPLAVTKTGQSPLVHAVLNTKCPERMVAECSRLGFSSHQPSLTGPQEYLLQDLIPTVLQMCHNSDSAHCHVMRQNTVTSPLVCAVLRDFPVLSLMLHESGACSRTEVLTLSTQLPKLTDWDTDEGSALYELIQMEAQLRRRRIADHIVRQYSRVTGAIERNAAFLRELACTPRTLRSSCRLMIAHHFHFSDTKRHQRLDALALPEPLKNYLEFSDLCDPEYGSDL